MEEDPDVPTRLEAAEALADLGDEDALDLLIEMLDDTDDEHDEMAAEMLDWLDLPRGNEALRGRGYAFETSGGKIAEAQEARPPRAESPAGGPARKAIEPGPAQSTALQVLGRARSVAARNRCDRGTNGTKSTIRRLVRGHQRRGSGRPARVCVRGRGSRSSRPQATAIFADRVAGRLNGLRADRVAGGRRGAWQYRTAGSARHGSARRRRRG